MRLRCPAAGGLPAAAGHLYVERRDIMQTTA
jgi:hypothetical protein